MSSGGGGGGGGGTETVMTTRSREDQGSSSCSFNGVITPQPQSTMQLAGYTAQGTPTYKPLTSIGDLGGGVAPPPPPPPFNDSFMGSSEPVKRRRGRPRKYVTDANMSLSILSSSSSPPPAASVNPPPPPPAAATTTSGGSTAVTLKKARGRPPGSTNKKHQLEPLGSVGAGFTPHVITVQAGEDISSKILSFSQLGPRAVCILSANGTISNATLRQPAISGGTVTYEGRFEILSLSGYFTLSDIGGQRSRTGGLSVSLSGPDGRVLGGVVEGPLTAASPLQVIVGSFIADGRTESKSGRQVERISVPRSLPSGSPATGPSSSHSHGTLSESPGAPGSPLNQSTGACNNHSSQVMSSMPWK